MSEGGGEVLEGIFHCRAAKDISAMLRRLLLSPKGSLWKFCFVFFRGRQGDQSCIL